MVLKKIQPMYTKIVTTMDMYIDETKAGELIDVSKLKKGIKEYQTVISVGPSVRYVKEGDVVCINPERYAIRKYSNDSVKNDLLENTVTRYNFNVVKIEDKDYLLLDEADVEFIVKEYE